MLSQIRVAKSLGQLAWVVAGSFLFLWPHTANAQAPTVTITPPTSNPSEQGPVGAAFNISRGTSAATALTVNYTFGGTATCGVDYNTGQTCPTGSVTIPANSTGTSLLITPVDDAVIDPNETVIVTLAAGGYTIGNPGSATLTIADNDPTVSIIDTCLLYTSPSPRDS